MPLRLFRFTALAAVFLAAPAAAAAQAAPTPSPIAVPTVPPGILSDPRVGAAIGIGTQILNAMHARMQNGAHGTVTYYRGYDLQVQTGVNSYRNVHLHRGTEIDPRGITIAPGMTVEVGGHANDDGSLDADLITVDR